MHTINHYTSHYRGHELTHRLIDCDGFEMWQTTVYMENDYKIVVNYDTHNNLWEVILTDVKGAFLGARGDMSEKDAIALIVRELLKGTPPHTALHRVLDGNDKFKRERMAPVFKESHIPSTLWSMF